MAGLPQLKASIDFTNGPAFVSTAFTLGDAIKGKLGTGQLADADDSADISSTILRVGIRRGRNRILDKFEAGSATVVLEDTTGAYNPSNPASPYYGKLVPLRKIRIWGEYEGVQYPLFAGYIQSYDTNFKVGVSETSSVTLKCVDGFRFFNNVSVTTLAGASAGQLSGSRITNFLDLVDWPQSQRAISTGDSELQNDPGTANRDVLGAIQLVEKSEFGAFYLDSLGTVNYLSRSDVSKKADSTPVVYADDGTGIFYQGIDFAYDDTLIVNDVTVQGLGLAAQNVFDQTSIDTYFLHSGVRDGLLVQTNTEANNQAVMLLAARKDAVLRIDSMTLNLYDEAAETRIIAALNSEIFDLINITKSVPGGSTVTRELFVQGIAHDITPRSWNTILLTSEPIIQAFILDSTTSQGRLDSGILSY
jgi:hypothetical protein